MRILLSLAFVSQIALATTQYGGSTNPASFPAGSIAVGAITPCAAGRFIGSVTGSTTVCFTAAQATSFLNVFGADSGSGGVKGLVPATVAGDAVKVLYGDGTWKAPTTGLGGSTGSTASAVLCANGAGGATVKACSPTMVYSIAGGSIGGDVLIIGADTGIGEISAQVGTSTVAFTTSLWLHQTNVHFGSGKLFGSAGTTINAPSGAFVQKLSIGEAFGATYAALGPDITIKEGTDKSAGTAVLVGGTVTITNANAHSLANKGRYQLTNCANGGVIGILSVGTIVDATSFVINSSSAADTSTVCWLMWQGT